MEAPDDGEEARRARPAYGKDGYALLSAIDDPGSPHWLKEIPAVGILRTVLDQNYMRTVNEDGTEVSIRREKGLSWEDGGLPPGDARIASPYDTDARWGVKRDEFWLVQAPHHRDLRRPPALRL